jgi:hypothetical protein
MARPALSSVAPTTSDRGIDEFRRVGLERRRGFGATDRTKLAEGFPSHCACSPYAFTASDKAPRVSPRLTTMNLLTSSRLLFISTVPFQR